MIFKKDYLFIIQARMGSKRFPGKVLHPIYKSKSTLDILLERFEDEKTNLLIATTNKPEDDQIEEYCKKNKLLIFRGSENNVISRFIEAAEENGFSKIIRVCADNPFIDKELCHILIDQFESDVYDYATYSYNNFPSIIYDHGIYCEIVMLNALKKTLLISKDKSDCEHVTSFIYNNPNLFKIKFLKADKLWKSINPVRLTFDTSEDFFRIKKILTLMDPKKYSIKALIDKLILDKNFLKLNKTGIKK